MFGNGRPRFLLLTTGYPRDGDLYQNAFIHRRVVKYQQAGMAVRVFWLWPPCKAAERYTFDGVQVVKGNHEVLGRELAAAAGTWQAALLHFIDPEMLRLLGRHEPDLRAIVWIHGVETEGCRRRLFNVRGPKGVVATVRRLPYIRRQRALLRRVYEGRDLGRRVDVVFVSTWYRENVAEADVGVAARCGHVIPNFVDEELFAHVPKVAADARRVLSVRPFTHRKYANDLMVKAVVQLTNAEATRDLEFTIVGDGPLWDSTTRPLQALANVTLQRRFLTHAEMSAMHRCHGVFLCPTRLDSQGVSMGEAMASGLVPVTNSVTAIPEFVDPECGKLARPGDHRGLARAVTELAVNPEDFTVMSRRAAERVRAQCGHAATIQRELDLMCAE